ncbi:hypothetical protein [Deinococcus maricopensis]|uniref:Putative radiation-induced protein n=1 Tax=Deinococcus maricopensis (strain DSM 21211 / LMG 22137 / NRRL B-23946 / LB-34) TaxID=709986 RepID=E8U5M3_DEIML|nr:hypothetical protein [Deinococcus maricopensis]ADV66362.1 putative radiation-induced protein [Deinococcus maricopensis DSM 21211]
MDPQKNDLLKKAGAMLAHLDLFHRMSDLRKLIQLANHMDERGDRAALVAPGTMTLYGADMTSDATITTSKGVTLSAEDAYRTLQSLKGFASDEYAVTRDELRALNARAVQDLEGSDELRAFGDALARISAPTAAPAPAPAAAATPPSDAPEKPARTRRAEGDAPATPAA